MTILMLAVACWRCSSMLVKETGPFRMFERLRELTGITHFQGEIVQIPDNVFAGILSCVWCSSVWVGVFWTVLYIISPTLALIASMPFVYSAGSIIIDLLVEKLKRV